LLTNKRMGQKLMCGVLGAFCMSFVLFKKLLMAQIFSKFVI